MRIKHVFLSALLAVIFIFSAQNSSAQFVNGRIYLGPHLGIGYYGGDISLGANIEGAITQPGSAGPGRIALAGRFDISFYSGGDVLFFAGMANYHYGVAEDKVDLFGGLGISFFSFSNAYYGATSHPYFAMDLGMRYFINSSMALRFMLGLIAYPYITFGVDWTL